MAFDSTQVKSKQSSNLRPRQIKITCMFPRVGTVLLPSLHNLSQLAGPLNELQKKEIWFE